MPNDVVDLGPEALDLLDVQNENLRQDSGRAEANLSRWLFDIS